MLVKTKDGTGVRLENVDNEDILRTIEILIITPQARVIDNGIINGMESLENIVVQEGVQILKGKSSRVIRNDSIKEIRLPSTLKGISNMFIKLGGVAVLNIKDTALESCVNSFNEIGVLELELPGTIRKVKNSFQNISGIKLCNTE